MSRRVWVCTMLAGTAGALSACASLPVTVDSAPGYSVASCHSYAFADEHTMGGEHAAFGNPLNADRLRTAIQGQMYARGIPEVPRTQADCIVGYAMGTRQVIDQYYAGWGPGWGWGWRGGWWGYDEPWVYDETRISIDFFDARARKPIWHGAVSETASSLTGPNAQSKINNAAAAIFAKVPPPAPGYAYPHPGYAPPPAPAAPAPAAPAPAAPSSAPPSAPLSGSPGPGG